MSIVAITPVKIFDSPGSGVWQDLDVSEYVPAGTSAVFLSLKYANTVSYISFRKNGSTDNLQSFVPGRAWYCVGVDVNRIFEWYPASAIDQYTLYLVGYATSTSVVYLTTAVEITPTVNQWTTVNLAATCPGAVGIIGTVIDGTTWANNLFGVRKTGSTDNRTQAAFGYADFVIGCDANHRIDAYRYSVGANHNHMYVRGYIKNTATFNTNANDISVGTYGDYADKVINVSDPQLLICEVVTGATNKIDLRENGSSVALYGSSYHTFAFVNAANQSTIEEKLEGIAVQVFQIGNFSAPTNALFQVQIALTDTLFSTSPTWTDITSDVKSIHIQRGRMHELDKIEASTATVILNNASGNYWRNNTAGLYTPNIKPLKLFQINASWQEATYNLFYGVTESFKHRWLEQKGGFVPITEVNCVDMFKTLSRYIIPSGTSYPAELSGARINHVLDTLGWPAELRDINTGQVAVVALNIPADTGGRNAMEHLQSVAEAENGIIFQAPDGYIVFQDSLARQISPLNTSQGTFIDDGTDSKYVFPEPVDDDTFIYNGADIVGTGFEAFFYDPDSVASQGSRIISRNNSLIYDANDAYDQVFTLVGRYRDSALRCPGLMIYPLANPSDLYPQVFGNDLSTRITLKLNSTRNPALIDKEYHIEGIQHDWEAGINRWETQWQLWDVNKYKVVRADQTKGHAGYIVKSHSSYATAQSAADGDVAFNDSNLTQVGQNELIGMFYVYRSGLQWDLSGISGTVLSAAIILYSKNSPFNLSFDLHAVDGSVCHYPLITTDYGDLLSKTTSWGSIASAYILATGWIPIWLNATGIAQLQASLGGTFRTALRSSDDISATAPGVNQSSVVIYTGSGSTTYPRLLIQLA